MEVTLKNYRYSKGKKVDVDKKDPKDGWYKAWKVREHIQMDTQVVSVWYLIQKKRRRSSSK